MDDKNFEKINIKYQISVSLDNFRFLDQVYPKNTLGGSIRTNAT